MKKTFTVSLVILFFISLFASPGYCGDYKGPIRKLTRGFCNLATFPVELPYRMDREFKGMGPEGLVYGFMEGMCMMAGRAVAGFYEIVTFPIPMPEKYEPVLTDPEFFFGNPLEKKQAEAK